MKARASMVGGGGICTAGAGGAVAGAVVGADAGAAECGAAAYWVAAITAAQTRLAKNERTMVNAYPKTKAR